MKDWRSRLTRKESAGSKPRCHLLTHGSPTQVADRLTRLIAPHGTVQPTDAWMPMGFDDLEEAQLHKAPRLVAAELGTALRDWWLAPASRLARTPNIDIAATCTVGVRPGLVLIEAKAHEDELANECAGRRPPTSNGDPTDRLASFATIGGAIAEASAGLAADTGLDVRISRDTCYQMSNRFAWAWKLTQLGRPVILVYLGFLNAEEMSGHSPPFASDDRWRRAVLNHSAALFPDRLWNSAHTCNGQAFIPLIRSMQIDLP